MLREFSQIIEDVDNCDVTRKASGEPYDYASKLSVMGGQHLSQSSIDFGAMPVYSTTDRAQLMPARYIIDTVDARPGSYPLSFGEGRRNGVVIELPDTHVAKQIDPRITRLVVTTEVYSHLSGDDQESVSDNDCQTNALCDISLTLASDDYQYRYELGETRFYFDLSEDSRVSRRVSYIDEELGIGIVVERGLQTDPTVVVVDYQTALGYAEEQYEEFSDYLADLKRDVEADN